MRKILLLVCLLSINILLYSAVYKTVSISAGGLSTALTAIENTSITDLTVLGTIDARDVKFIRENITSLEVLNISKTSILAYSGNAGTDSLFSNYPANEIPKFSFRGNDNIGKKTLKSIILPNTVTSIGEGAFILCIGLTNITFNSSITSIGSYAFYGCSSISSMTIPTVVTSIGDYSFSNCTGLTSINLPNSVISLGEWTFSNCTNLNSIILSNTLQTIGHYAFYGCNRLTSLTIPNSVSSIGESAFSGCSALVSMAIPNSVSIIANSTFSSCNSLSNITLPSTITSIRDWAFLNCKNLTSITIPSSVDSIGNGCFYNCSKLININIPNSVSSIGEYAFLNCTSIINMNVPSSVSTIKNSTFSNCSGMKTLSIPSSVTIIDPWAFYKCISLSKVSIPSSVDSIGEYAFSDCTGLASIYSYKTSPITVTSNTFLNVSKSTCALFVPKNTKSAYLIKAIWNTFTTILEMPESHFKVAFIGNGQNHMNLNIVNATLNGMMMDSGDEIAAFDDSICCGTVILTQPINKANSSSLVTIYASNADVGLSNGFFAGKNISFKYWDLSKNEEISLITPLFIDATTGQSTTIPAYAPNETAFVQLSGKDPFANAGIDQTINEGTIVTLDGSASSDANANTLVYLWTAPNGITLNSTTTSKPTFMAPEVEADSILTFSLVVTEGTVNSIADQVLITVKQKTNNQQIALVAGWNLVSLNVLPAKTNLQDLFQPLIDGGKLKIVKNETGNSIDYFESLGGWKNTIGTFSPTEGYKIRMNGVDTLTIEGNPIPLPLAISLKAGWNIISYPCATTQDALKIVQPLIDTGLLVKATDEMGKSIENFGSYGGWVNGIGNFNPNKGYNINVLQSGTLIITSTELRLAASIFQNQSESFFDKVFDGNGVDHMNINLVNLDASIIKIGDELGIFDGKNCVGSAIVSSENLTYGRISIVTSCNDGMDGSINGFIPGNVITIKLLSNGTLYDLNVENLSSSAIFEKYGSFFAKIDSKIPTDTQNIEDSNQIRSYPNPFTEEVSIQINNAKSEALTVDIYSLFGQRIKRLYVGNSSGVINLKWNGTDGQGHKVNTGAYFCKVNGKTIKILYNGKK